MKKYALFIMASAFFMTAMFNGCQSTNLESAVSSNPQAESADAQSQADTEDFSDIIEPEQLISKADAESILGISVADGEKTENAVVGQKICFYDGMNDDINGFLQISISQDAFIANAGAMSAESIYTSTKEMFGEDLTPVEGLGDDAFLATGGYYILYKGYFISVYSGNTDMPEVIERLDIASRIAIQNLDALLQ